MNKSQNTNKWVRIRIMRIVLSLLLLPLFGIAFYFWFTGLYRESIFRLALLFSFPKIFLIMLLPSMVYTAIMEYSGLKLIQKQRQTSRILIHVLLYLLIGTFMGVFYELILTGKTGSDLYIIVLLTGFSVTIIKMALHFLERKYRES